MIDTKYVVVIVTYNRQQLLQECVDSVENQTVIPYGIIIVNNASTDSTFNYLEEIRKNNQQIDIIHLPNNIGGAGGFAKGIERALKKDIDCLLLIDDDAIIAEDFMERILYGRQQYPQYKAFAGVVKINGKIDTSHRRNLSEVGLLSKRCKEYYYTQAYFICDIASFCGMVLDVNLIRRIGLPHAEYFIWYDDTEYSLRIRRYSRFLVVTKAELNHKTQLNKTFPRRYDWKEYYAIRNRLLMVKEHGNCIDWIVNFIDLFVHIIFRNWWFGVIKRDKYDWKYERMLVTEAIKNVKNQKLDNVIINRDE